MGFEADRVGRFPTGVTDAHHVRPGGIRYGPDVRRCCLLLVVMGIVYMLDTIELLRRAAGKPQATFAIVCRMALFKLPQVIQEAFPFIVLFSSI